MDTTLGQHYAKVVLGQCWYDIEPTFSQQHGDNIASTLCRCSAGSMLIWHWTNNIEPTMTTLHQHCANVVLGQCWYDILNQHWTNNDNIASTLCQCSAGPMLIWHCTNIEPTCRQCRDNVKSTCRPNIGPLFVPMVNVDMTLNQHWANKNKVETTLGGREGGWEGGREGVRPRG